MINLYYQYEQCLDLIFGSIPIIISYWIPVLIMLILFFFDELFFVKHKFMTISSNVLLSLSILIIPYFIFKILPSSEIKFITLTFIIIISTYTFFDNFKNEANNRYRIIIIVFEQIIILYFIFILLILLKWHYSIPIVLFIIGINITDLIRINKIIKSKLFSNNNSKWLKSTRKLITNATVSSIIISITVIIISIHLIIGAINLIDSPLLRFVIIFSGLLFSIYSVFDYGGNSKIQIDDSKTDNKIYHSFIFAFFCTQFFITESNVIVNICAIVMITLFLIYESFVKTIGISNIIMYNNNLKYRNLQTVMAPFLESVQSITSGREKLLSTFGNNMVLSVYDSEYYISRLNLFSIEEIIRNANHHIIIYPNDLDLIDDAERWEYLNVKMLSRLHTAINIFSELTISKFLNDNSFDLNNPFHRTFYYLIICDEKPVIINNIEKNIKLINRNIPIENHKINNDLFKLHIKQEFEIHEAAINSSIFELALLYRQMYSISNLASRMIALVDLAECMAIYQLALITASDKNNIPIWQNSDEKIFEQVSFGNCMNVIRIWLSQKEFNHPVHNNLAESLQFVFEDVVFIKEFSKLIKESLGIEYTWPKQITTVDIYYFLTSVRNRTRGHGAPTKANFEVVLYLHRIILFLFDSLNKIPGNMFARSSFMKSDFILDLHSGPCPRIFKNNDSLENFYESEEIKKHHAIRNHIFKNADIPDNNYDIWWIYKDSQENNNLNLSKILHLNEGRIYMLSERKNNKSVFISHSTGDVINSRT